jgi:phospholipid/cholesterol/gamma-HCH transport system substrate-binding protein
MIDVARLWRVLIALALVLFLAGCRFNGIDSMALPGGKGQGADAITVSAELPDVGTLVPNAEVKVNDIAVGTVTSIRAEKWHAVAVLRLDHDVKIPANALAKVGVNTLLGAAYVELTAPPHAVGSLADGATIPLERGHAYPATEQVLSAASLALNGGGLEQIATITTELNRALGSDHAVGNLLPTMDRFVGSLDAQRGDIVTAIKDVSRLSKRFADNRGSITKALDELGPALDVLARDRPDLTAALEALTRLSATATPLVNGVKSDFVADLKDLAPVLRAVTAADKAAITAIGFASTFPFAPETVLKACRGSYCNLDLTLDLTNAAITSGFIRPDGSVGLPGLPGLPDLGDLLGSVVQSVTGLITGLSQPTTGSASTNSPTTSGTSGDGGLQSALSQLLGGILGGSK